jgi:hypothetical protein
MFCRLRPAPSENCRLHAGSWCMRGRGSFRFDMSERRALDAASHSDETAMPDIINFGTLQLRFLHSKDDTGGSVDISK